MVTIINIVTIIIIVTIITDRWHKTFNQLYPMNCRKDISELKTTWQACGFPKSVDGG